MSPDGKKNRLHHRQSSLTMDNNGENKEQVTKISPAPLLRFGLPDGKWFAFTSDVYPDCNNDDCNKKKDEAVEKSKSQSARHYSPALPPPGRMALTVNAPYVFVVSSKGGTARDLTQGDLGFTGLRCR